LAGEPYVARCRDGYAVVQPADRATPKATDQVIASGIETVERAQEIATARSQRFRNVLDRALEALREYDERYREQYGDDNWVAEVMTDLERARDFKVGPVSLDEL
jgi:hypothetical protein